MGIKSFLKDCRARGIHLYLKDGELSYRSKEGAMTEKILTSAKERKADLLVYLNHNSPPASRFQLTSTFKDRAM